MNKIFDLDLIRDINDPEHPMSLEELNVVQINNIDVIIYFILSLKLNVILIFVESRLTTRITVSKLISHLLFLIAVWLL